MILSFKSQQVKGAGRGKLLGYPTLNMDIPEEFQLEDGIFAVWVKISGRKMMGAMHFGAVPTFDQAKKSLEVFLLDVADKDFEKLDTSQILIDVVSWLRGIMRFRNSEELSDQIRKDVVQVRRVMGSE